MAWNFFLSFQIEKLNLLHISGDLLIKAWEVKLSTTFNPQTDGQAGRTIKTL